MSATLFISHKIGSLWIPFLIKDKAFIGEVINIFRRTVNIRCINNMLLSITALNYSSPIYVNVTSDIDEIDFQKHIRPYEEVFFEKPYITIGNIRISTDLSKEKIYFPRTCSMCDIINSFVCSYDFLLRLYKKVFFLINIIDKPNNILELIIKTNLENEIYSILKQMRKYIVSDGRNQLLSNKIYRLLGLGYGVTPSTDDFIGGLLGILNIYLACNKKRSPIILNRERILSKTSWVSGYLLYYNHLGLFNSIFEEFIGNLFRMNLNRSINSFLSLLSIGHTSGLDMGLGALSALAVIGEAITGREIIDEYFDLFFRKFIVK